MIQLRRTCVSQLVPADQWTRRRCRRCWLDFPATLACLYLHKLKQSLPCQNVAKVPVLGCLVTCWDLGGQVSFRVIWEQYYKEAQCIIFVVDSCDEERLAEAAATFEALMAHPDLEGIPVLVLANKQDKKGAKSVDALCGKGLEKEGQQGSNSDNAGGTGAAAYLATDEVRRSGRPFKACGVSALKGDGVEQAMLWLVSAVKVAGPRDGSGGGFL